MDDPKVDVSIDPNKLTAAASDIKAFLETLLPPDTIEIHDVYGNAYACRTVASFRAQLRLGRGMQRIQSIVSESAGNKFTGASGMIASILTAAATSEEFSSEIVSMFETAHPDVVAKAKAKALAADVGAPTDVLDLFAGEEVVAALVPLFARPMGRIGTLIGTMTRKNP